VSGPEDRKVIAFPSKGPVQAQEPGGREQGKVPEGNPASSPRETESTGVSDYVQLGYAAYEEEGQKVLIIFMPRSILDKYARVELHTE